MGMFLLVYFPLRNPAVWRSLMITETNKPPKQKQNNNKTPQTNKQQARIIFCFKFLETDAQPPKRIKVLLCLAKLFVREVLPSLPLLTAWEKATSPHQLGWEKLHCGVGWTSFFNLRWLYSLPRPPHTDIGLFFALNLWLFCPHLNPVLI